MEIEKCEVTVIHENVVRAVKEQMPDEDKLVATAELLKVYGDPTRIKISIRALLKVEMCVCDLSALLDVSQSGIPISLKH